MPNDTMGNPDNLVWDQVKKAAKANNISEEKTVANIKKTMDKALEEEKTGEEK